MKNTTKILFKAFAVLFLVIVSITGCSKDDNPVDNDLFIGQYKGHITYNFEDKHVDVPNGTVEVVKIGKNYNFIFSDNIPDLTAIEFKKDGDNTLINIDSDQAHYIRIDQSTLVIAFTKDNKIWSANTSR